MRALALGVLGAALSLAAACGLSLQGEPGGAGDAGDHDAGSDAGAGGAVGGSGGSGGSLPDANFGGNAGGGGTPVTLPYAYRRRLRITPASAVPAGASIRFSFDHMALVAAQKARADANDVRIFYKGSADAQELDRVLDPASAWNASNTTIWFRAQSAIQVQPDASYYLYYGDPQAGNPPADGGQVYTLWDGFDGSTLDPSWNGAQIGSAAGSFTVASGVLHVQGATGDIWNNDDNFLFLERPLNGDFIADARVSASGGALSGWAKVGGLMIRQSLLTSSRNRLVSPVNGGAAVTNSYRLSDGASTAEDSEPGPNPIPEWVGLIRTQQKSRAFHSNDGVNWLEVGAEITFAGLADPVLFGVPFANNSGGAGWVELDWIRVRAYMAEEPKVVADPEEPGPFTR